MSPGGAAQLFRKSEKLFHGTEPELSTLRPRVTDTALFITTTGLIGGFLERVEWRNDLVVWGNQVRATMVAGGHLLEYAAFILLHTPVHRGLIQDHTAHTGLMATFVLVTPRAGARCFNSTQHDSYQTSSGM